MNEVDGTEVRAVAARAREAAAELAASSRQVKDVALLAMADALDDATPAIVTRKKCE